MTRNADAFSFHDETAKAVPHGPIPATQFRDQRECKSDRTTASYGADVDRRAKLAIVGQVFNLSTTHISTGSPELD